jgi:hypothetical protein
MQHTFLQCLLVLALVSWASCGGPFTSTSTRAIQDVAKAYTTSYSCSSSSAESYGGLAVAYSQSNSKSIIAASDACAKAVVNAFASKSTGCRRADLTVSLSAAAIACARSSIVLRTSSVASALSKGRSTAVASACGYSAAYSVTYSKAIAKAVGSAFAGACNAESSATGKLKVTAIAKALTQGLAGSFAYAATFGKGNAKSSSSALFAADVSVYAKAIGELFAFACTNCGGRDKCGYCAKGLKDGDFTTSDSLAIAAKGRLALASAFSDAMSAVCQKQITVEAAAKACLQAVGEVCVQIAAKACGWAAASGNAAACSSSYSTGSAYALSKAFGSLVADATAMAFKYDTCVASAFSTVTANVFVNIKVDQIVRAIQKGCVSSRGSRSVTYSAVASALKLSDNTKYAKAFSNAIGAVVTSCECAGNGWCCNCGLKNPKCPY